MSHAKWIRDRWPHEANNFTPWLKNNLELVSNSTGLELTQLGQEVSAAGGRADIVAWETKSNTKVVIENQIESANARHFQQLVAYGESLEARIRIWVASSFSEKFRRLTSHENMKEESKPEGAIYYLLKIARSKDEKHKVVLFLDLAPTQSQIDKVLFTDDERTIKRRLMKEFWNQWGSRPVKPFNISKRVKATICRSVDINEARISVVVWCFKGFGRRERIKHVNSYCKRLATDFSETFTNTEWSYDEVSRNILVLTRHIDLGEYDSWAQIRDWFLDTELRIVSKV